MFRRGEKRSGVELTSESEATISLDNNTWVKFYHYDLGANTFPNIGYAKTPPKGMKWRNGEINYQENSVSNAQLSEWLEQNKFKDGLSIMMGRLWRGKYQGYYVATFDADNELAVKLLLKILYQFRPEQYLLESAIGRIGRKVACYYHY